MAGIRQHYLPCFLSKGFVSRTKKSQKYTFVFQKDKPAFETNITKIGVEKYFYGNPDVPETDDMITQQENNHSIFLDDLRRAGATGEQNFLDPIACASFVSHITNRAKHIRHSMINMYNSLGDSIRNPPPELDSEKFSYRFIENNKEIFSQALRKTFSKKLSPFQTETVIIQIMRNPECWSSLIPPEALSDFILLVQKFREKSLAIVSKAHNNALRRIPESTGNIERMKCCKWRMILKEDRPYFILGDVGPIGYVQKNNRFMPLLFCKGDYSHIFMPISFNQLLIGTMPEIDLFAMLSSPAIINESIASLSRDFFIAETNTSAELELQKKLSSEITKMDKHFNRKASQKIKKDLYGD